jgi:hypothetical protein
MSEEQNTDILYNRQKIFIDSLRKEASDAKACVTQYSFQCLAISGTALGFIFNNSKNNDLACLASIPLIALLMIMARIAIYKYEMANRAYGYEFYLKKAMSLVDCDNILFKEEVDALKFTVFNEHWEQTFFAWRTIAPTLFRGFYKVDYPENFFSLMKPYAYKPIFPKDKDLWILIKNRIDPTRKHESQNKVVYFAGSYLANILVMLVIMQLLLTLPLIYSTINLYCYKFLKIKYLLNVSFDTSLFSRLAWNDKNTIVFINGIFFSRASILLFATCLLATFIWIRWQRIERRREIIESELYSIRTCSLLWSIIAKVHFLSWSLARNETLKSLSLNDSIDFPMTAEYERNLILCADYIFKNCCNPSTWNMIKYIEDQKASSTI